MSLQTEYQKMIQEKNAVDSCMAITYEAIAHLYRLLCDFNPIIGGYERTFQFNTTTLSFINTKKHSNVVLINDVRLDPFSQNNFQTQIESMAQNNSKLIVDDFLSIFFNIDKIYSTITKDIGELIKVKTEMYEKQIPKFILNGVCNAKKAG